MPELRSTYHPAVTTSTPSFALPDGQSLALSWHRGRWVHPAREFGHALGYSGAGKRLVTLITGEWSAEFVEGMHYLRIAAADAGPTKGPSDGPLPRGRAALYLTAEGIHLVTLKSETELGRRIRNWLATEVLVQIADTGTYSAQPASTLTTREADLSALTEQLAEQSVELRTIRVALGVVLEELQKQRAALPAPPAPALPAPEDAQVFLHAGLPAPVESIVTYDGGRKVIWLNREAHAIWKATGRLPPAGGGWAKRGVA